MGREVAMAIKVKITPTETLDVSKAVDMINEVCIELGDGHWEGTGLYREFFKLLTFEEGTLDTMVITLEKPDRDEIVLDESDSWEYEGGRGFPPFEEYIDYYVTATEDWGMFDRDYKLKDATREEVLDYVMEVMEDIISNHGDEVQSLAKYRGKMLEELMSALKKARDSKPAKARRVKK